MRLSWICLGEHYPDTCSIKFDLKNGKAKSLCVTRKDTKKNKVFDVVRLAAQRGAGEVKWQK